MVILKLVVIIIFSIKCIFVWIYFNQARKKKPLRNTCSLRINKIFENSLNVPASKLFS